MKRTKGFTIIELLIVIVVITILAVIGIVTYSSIQKRATNAAITSEVNGWTKILAIYKEHKGGYPLTDIPVAGFGATGAGYICLGDLQRYPAEGDFEEGNCFASTGYAPASPASAALMNEIKNGVSGTTTNLPGEGLHYKIKPTPGSAMMRGVTYVYSAFSKTNKSLFLDYYLYGKNCLSPEDYFAYTPEEDVVFCRKEIIK